MNKMLTMSLLVLGCSIVVFFSKEFGHLIKKIMAIRTMPLLFPVTLVTIFLVLYEQEVAWYLTFIQSNLLFFTQRAAKWLSLGFLGNYLVNLILLMALTLCPALAANSWYKRKTYHSFKYAGIMMALIWIFTAMLLTIT